MAKVKFLFKLLNVLFHRVGYPAFILAAIYLMLSGGSALAALFCIMMAILMATEIKIGALENRVSHLESLLLEEVCFDSTPQTNDSQTSKSEMKDQPNS